VSDEVTVVDAVHEVPAEPDPTTDAVCAPIVTVGEEMPSLVVNVSVTTSPTLARVVEALLDAMVVVTIDGAVLSNRTFESVVLAIDENVVVASPTVPPHPM